MKKFLSIAAGVSLASVIGLANIALADEKDDSKNDDEAQAVDYNSSRSNTSTAVKTGGDGSDEDDTPQGSGDPLKGLNVARCDPLPCTKGISNDGDKDDEDQGITVKVPFQDAIDANKKGISTDGGEGDDAQGSGDPLKGLNVARAKKKEVAKPDDGNEDDDSKKKKKEKDK